MNLLKYVAALANHPTYPELEKEIEALAEKLKRIDVFFVIAELMINSAFLASVSESNENGIMEGKLQISKMLNESVQELLNAHDRMKS